MTTHHGSCHCGGVRIAIDASADIEALECNCSMCQKLGFLHLIVPAKDFRLEAGAELLTTYTFNTGVAKHTFCSRCGVKPFYVPRSNPDGFSVTCVASTAPASAPSASNPSMGRTGSKTPLAWRTFRLN
ncbi:MAG: GFA family protein [Oceanococcaceae bacterium]